MNKSLVIVSAGIFAPVGLADNRDVQFRGINLDTGVVEVFNYGVDAIDLTGWRFCSHDDNQRRRYSSADGLDGMTLEAGASIFVHFNNDAPNEPGHFDRFGLGDFATPLGPGVFAMGLYFPTKDGFVIFGDGDFIADHLQWSIDGQDNDIADERSDEAVTGGVWIGESAWIVTDKSTGYIRLNDFTGGILHGPDDYAALDEMPDCNNNGVDDFIDVIFGGSRDDNENDIPDECEGCDADLDGDGDADADDFFDYLDAFAGGNLPICDIDQDGDCDADDFFGYLDLFAQGC